MEVERSSKKKKSKKKSQDDPKDEVVSADSIAAANRDAIEQICASSSNNVCADCKQVGTRWAVVNLGIFVCLRCSGVHRSLGVQVSKVKSTSLDAWSSSEVTLMRMIGNTEANKLWEANLDPSESISPTSNDDLVSAFIKRKYVEKAFASSTVDVVYKTAFKAARYGKYSKKEGQKKGSTPSPQVPETVSTEVPKTDPKTAMLDLYGSEIASKRVKRGKKEVVIHGVFGKVNVPSDIYDAKRSRTLKAFGLAPPDAEGATPKAADGDQTIETNKAEERETSLSLQDNPPLYAQEEQPPCVEAV